MRRKDRIARKGFFKPQPKQEAPVRHKEHNKGIYYTHYKALMLIPLILIVLSLVVMGMKYAQTGDFVIRGITLKGGTSITIVDGKLEPTLVSTQLQAAFPKREINVRTLENSGSRAGIIVESDVLPEDTAGTLEFLGKLKELTGKTDKDLSIETMGSSLGNSFFNQTMVAMLIAFVLMSIVVFLNFKTFVPSMAVILAVLSNTIMTVAAMDVLGLKLGTAGIAALLMLIGYSVDTDILLSTRVLKSKEGSIYERIVGAIGTGLVMNAVTMAATIVALIFAQSDVLKEIALVILIGLVADMINTWIQNAGILRWYLERKGEI